MKNARRKASGQAIAELPVAIFTFIMVLMLPMLNLATLAMRVTNVFAAARNAAFVAGRSANFSAAVNAAKAKAIQTNELSLAGVAMDRSDIRVFIVGTPLVAGKAPIRQEQALPVIDTKSYLYQVEVVVKGKIAPLAPLSQDIFGKVPGLTDNFEVTSACREFCERPKGFTSK